MDNVRVQLEISRLFDGMTNGGSRLDMQNIDVKTKLEAIVGSFLVMGIVSGILNYYKVFNGALSLL